MQIDVEHIAHLARLGLTAEEKKLYAEQLSRILEYAETIKKLNTDQVPPLTHTLPLKNVMREDRVISCENTADIINHAPEEEGRMFKVPRILE